MADLNGESWLKVNIEKSEGEGAEIVVFDDPADFGSMCPECFAYRAVEGKARISDVVDYYIDVNINPVTGLIEGSEGAEEAEMVAAALEVEAKKIRGKIGRKYGSR
jgi:hypothetical protein